MSFTGGGDELLRAATFNVRYATATDGENAWDERRDLVASLLRYHRPDVVGLQEVLPDQRRFIEAELDAYEWVGRGRLEDGDGEHVLVGYRPDVLDVADHGTFWLSETPSIPGSESWNTSHPRTATWAEFEWRGGTFLFCATHLDHRSDEARAEGAILLGEHLDDLSDGRPTVLVGDFNCQPGSPAYEYVTDAETGLALVDAMETATHGHHGPTETFHEFTGDADERIDYVFVTPGVDVYQHAVIADRTDERYPSDHFPVVADVRGFGP